MLEYFDDEFLFENSKDHEMIREMRVKGNQYFELNQRRKFRTPLLLVFMLNSYMQFKLTQFISAIAHNLYS